VLVTGGAGFIGSNVVDYILSNNPEVQIMVYDNLSRRGVEKNIERLNELYRKSGRLKIVKGDIRDFEKLRKTAKDVSEIYHTAAQVAVTTSLQDPRTDFEINALGTLNVLELARRLETDPIVLYTSSNKVYGNLLGAKLEEYLTRYDFAEPYKSGISENQPLDPCTPYGCSKAVGDAYTLDYAKTYGLKTIVFRMSCVYGTYQYGNEDQGWVAHFVISTILDKFITVYGDGKQVRDILYISDLINAFQQAIKNVNKTRGQAYNIGGGPNNTISLLELIQFLEGIAGKKVNYNFAPWRPADQKVYYTNITKAKADFGWKPSINKEEGIRRLYAWVSENQKLFESLR
jgi:CDP-paratose 2-epimerase